MMPAMKFFFLYSLGLYFGLCRLSFECISNPCGGDVVRCGCDNCATVSFSLFRSRRNFERL